MKIYTRTGDAGFTSLPGSQRARKDDPRILACGLIDELNCSIGLALAEAMRVGHGVIADLLAPVQGELFAVAARIASPGTDTPPRPLGIDATDEMERRIDVMAEDLAPLGSFILPGGCELACRLHVCRAVCRRAEAGVVHLLDPGAEESPHDPVDLGLLNRLSDLLFVAARTANHDAGCAEVQWPPSENETT